MTVLTQGLPRAELQQPWGGTAAPAGSKRGSQRR